MHWPGVWGMALEVVLDKIAKDAQERLIYSAQKVRCTQSWSRQEIL